MEKLCIHGGKRLKGKVRVSGAKNAAVAVLPAALLTDETCIIDNLPYIADVTVLADILSELGARVKLEPEGRMIINSSGSKKVSGPL